MLSYICKSLILVAILHQVSGNQDNVVEWKDYINGKLPAHSIDVGNTEYGPDGIPVYVGLVHVINGPNEGYLPTSILAGVPYVNVSLDDETIVSIKENIKILCGKGDYKNKIGWIYTSQFMFPSLFEEKKFRPIRAGWQVGGEDKVRFNSSIYVGKGTKGQFGENYVGKIYHNHSDPLINNGLYSPGWYSTVWHFGIFDSLVYYL